MIHKKQLKSNRRWRESILFFAAFFCLSTFFVGCKKYKNPTGQNVLPSGTLLHSGGVDTFQIKTYSVHEDDIVTKDPSLNILGSYVDPVFGKVEASFYTQLTLSGFSPNFGNLNELTIDSAVMAFVYGGYYGDFGTQSFEVYQVLGELSSDSSYTNSSSVIVGSQNLVPLGKENIAPDLDNNAIVGSDTLDHPELRIPIDTIFARQILQIAHNSASDDDFLAQIKGLYFQVNNPMQNVGEGGVLYLSSVDPASKLTIYYHNAEGANTYDLLINGEAVDFNHLQTDFSGTPVQQVINDTISGQLEFYTQSFTTRAKIDFPTIENLPKNIIIHSAILELPINYYIGSNFLPSKEVIVSAKLFSNDDTKYLISSVQYDEMSHSYSIDVRTYIQNILNGEIQNNGIYVSPKNFVSSTDRMVFNGAKSPYKKQPKLTIVYTKL